MKVVFDYQAFTMQKFGGISRYYCEIIEEFSKMKNIESELLIKYSDNYYIKQFDKIKVQTLIASKQFKGKTRLMNFLNQMVVRRNLKGGDFDVLHPTYYNPYFLKSLYKKPFVVTAYDMIHEKFSTYFPEKDKTTAYKKELFLRSNKIIAISQNTKQDLMEIFNIPEERINVIYLASSLKPNLVAVDVELPPKYILYVGTRGGYKNFGTFIKGIEKLLIGDEQLFLVCFGGGAVQYKEFNNSKISSKIIYMQGDDVLLAELYSNAHIFVFPSLYEGFGIPVLEAMNCGCPTLLSNTSSLREIGGDAAVYFNPYEQEDIYEKVNSTIYDNEKKDKMKMQGVMQSRKFSWERAAKETMAVYQGLV